MRLEPESRGFDVVVIGSGVGGLCAAALLAHRGRRVLVVERDTHVGGRISTREVDGWRRPEGGVAIELGGPMEAISREVGARYDVRAPTPSLVVRVAGRSIDMDSWPARVLLWWVIRPVGALALRFWKPPEDPLAEQISIDALIARFTSNPIPRRLARNMAAGILGLNGDEIPARALITYLTKKSAFRRYGFCPRGSIGVMEELADVVRRRGGEVWLSSAVDDIEVDGGRVVAVVVSREGERVRIACDAVVSNAGPVATMELAGVENLPADYVEAIRARDLPRPMFIVDIASRGPLLGEAGLVFFGDTTRLAALAHVTSTCPEVAPVGWRLYTAYGVPVPAVGPYDEERELQTMMDELHAQLSNFDDVTVMRKRVIKGDWPALRTASGREAPMDTPIANLWNVGDGVREYGDGGMQSCATTGRIVAERLLRAMPARASA